MTRLELGQTVQATRTFTQEDLDAYIALTGDTVAGGSVPGPLLGGLFSYLLGTRLPGPGTNYLKQRLVFRTRARVGEALTARVEIVRLRPDKGLVNLRTLCLNEAGEIVCEGEALVLAREVVSVNG